MSSDYIYLQSGKPTTSPSINGTETWTFSWSGLLFAKTGTAPFPIDVPSELRQVRFTVGVAGNGNTTFDIKKNGSTIFDTTPVLPANSQWVRVTSGFHVSKFAVDDILTVDIVSVSGAVAPQDLTVTLRVKALA